MNKHPQYIVFFMTNNTEAKTYEPSYLPISENAV